MWNVKSIFLLSIYFMMFEIRSLSSEVFMLQPPGGRSDSVFDVSCLGEAGCFYACNQIWSKPSYHSPVVFCCVLTHEKERIWPFYAHTYKQIKKQLFSCGINCLACLAYWIVSSWFMCTTALNVWPLKWKT